MTLSTWTRMWQLFFPSVGEGPWRTLWKHLEKEEMCAWSKDRTLELLYIFYIISICLGFYFKKADGKSTKPGCCCCCCFLNMSLWLKLIIDVLSPSRIFLSSDYSGFHSYLSIYQSAILPLLLSTNRCLCAPFLEVYFMTWRKKWAHV